MELTQLGALVNELDRAEKGTTDKDARNRAKALKGLALVCQSAFLSVIGFDNEDAFRRHFAYQFDLFGELVRELENACEGCAPGTSIAERTKIGVSSIVNYKK